MREFVLATLLASLALAAQAQSTSPFYGNWKVTWEGKKQVYEAKLVLGAQGGTWKDTAHQKNNPCLGREAPVKITAISDQEATLILAFSDALPGCKDSTIILKASGAAVAGTSGSIQLALTRE